MTRRTKEIYRDACRRSHRILASYLALWAWSKAVDCIVIDRQELFSYLGIKAMRGQRLQWLAKDIRDLFPYTKALYKGTGAHASTYLSRLEFPRDTFKGRMYDEERIKELERGGLRAADVKLPREGRIVVFLASAAAGVKSRNP